MWDKNWFYYTKNINSTGYFLDVWTSTYLEIENNEYITFFKRYFEKTSAEDLQNQMALITQSQQIDFNLDENFFVYWLTYYQRNLKLAHFKWGDIKKLEIYSDFFRKFNLELKLRHYLEIHGNYPTLEELKTITKDANLNQTVSFILALAIIYWKWHFVEEEDDVYLSNVLIRFPFDGTLADYQEIVLNLEDVLLKNKIYNYLTYTKKWEFIWNIKDFNLLEVMWGFLANNKVRFFFQLDEPIKPIFSKKLDTLKEQLNNDLRIKIDNFKLTQIEGIKIKF